MRNERVPIPATGLPGQSFLESVSTRGPSRSAPIGLALLFHLSVATVLFVSSTFVLDDSIQPPLGKIAWFDIAPSVPASGPARPPAERPVSQSPPSRPQNAYSPPSIPDQIPVASTPSEEFVPDYSGPFIEGAFPSNEPGGGGTGVLGGDKSVSAPVTEVVEPIRITTGVTPPVEIYRVNPAYPEAARRGRIEGTVILEAIISAAGEVESVRILRSAHPLLDRAAMEAVPQWRYRAALFNGQKVPVYLSVAVHFQLR